MPHPAALLVVAMPPPMKITGTTKYQRRQKKAQLPLLPGDAGLLKQIEKQREATRQSKMINEPLEYIGPLKDFSPVKSLSLKELDILSVVNGLTNQMWEEYPKKPNGAFTLSHKVLSECEEYRKTFPSAASVNQLYGVFPASNTKVDQAINQLCREDKLKLLQVSSSDSSRDLVIEGREFYKICDPISPQLGLLCRSRPDATWFDAKELRDEGIDIALAVKNGLLVVDPGRVGVHSLAIPNQGRILKLLQQSRTWLLRTMTQHNRKFKELPESQILDKLEASKKHWTQLHGVKLDWVLYDAIGGGWVDGFHTPMGRGWKVLKS